MKTRHTVILLALILLSVIALFFLTTGRNETPPSVSYSQTEPGPMQLQNIPNSEFRPARTPVPVTEDEGPEEIVICNPGDTQICQCRDGQPGKQTCNATGTVWSACRCDPSAEPAEKFPGAGLDCTPGDIRPCYCNSGFPGTRMCMPDGTTWTDCECQNLEDGPLKDQGPMED
ncbi:hypothetical protein [Desulfosudis oleivorans]|uniref:Uncharacterized protein n=1 Tax=Desulfosudis oleivorans (strain DSM 6200 / JCM 39069 / Hxd3) TaxID=96561 RepID=A8ZTR3_DESOH|nr:hypothetical protein [Desulfosudis oleivorans]ABW67846.1 hypothetical protein Dole_2042 [Desulfosudis oleivorans Hxd3]